MADSPPLTPEGWRFYCETCGESRTARLAQERDRADRSEYFELVCMVCDSVLLTFEIEN